MEYEMIKRIGIFSATMFIQLHTPAYTYLHKALHSYQGELMKENRTSETQALMHNMCE